MTRPSDHATTTVTTDAKCCGTHSVCSRTAKQVAERLLDSSAKHSFDPDKELDWDAPFEEGKWFWPPELVSLYDTPLWKRMREEQRMDLSRHEAASLASLGIWFEIILMQLLVRHIYDKPLTSSHVRYALTEIEDECRHSKMFARLITKGGAPAYPVSRRAPQPGPRPQDHLHHPRFVHRDPARRGDPRLDAAADLPGRARPAAGARRHPHPCRRGGAARALRPRGAAPPDGDRPALGAGVHPDQLRRGRPRLLRLPSSTRRSTRTSAWTSARPWPRSRRAATAARSCRPARSG